MVGDKLKNESEKNGTFWKKVRKNILSKAKVFLQMLGFVPVRKQVMENALRMGQTAVYEYFCGMSPYHWAQENLHTPFKINREFSESSPNQKKLKKNTFESQYLYTFQEFEEW